MLPTPTRSKRADLFRTDVHLLEIDLIRAGRRPSLATKRPPGDYFALLSRAEDRPAVGIWPIALADPLPVVPIPLRQPDPDVPLDLGAVLRHIYASARYDLRVDYQQAPPPPELSPEEHNWLDAILRERGLR